MNKKNQDKSIKKPRSSGRGFSNNSKKPVVGEIIKSFWKQHRKILIPALGFLVLVSAFIFVYSLIVESRPFHEFMRFTALITGFMLNITGRGVSVADTVVSSNQFAFQIVDLCTAVMPMLIFSAAVLAFPSSWKEKLLGLITGIICIFIVNQIRLVSLFFIGAYLPGIFETAHLLIWQSLMILTAIGLWLIWVYKYVNSTSK